MEHQVLKLTKEHCPGECKGIRRECFALHLAPRFTLDLGVNLAQLERSESRLRGISCDDPRGVANSRRAGGKSFKHDGRAPDRGAISDGDVAEHGRTSPDQHVIPYLGMPVSVPIIAKAPKSDPMQQCAVAAYRSGSPDYTARSVVNQQAGPDIGGRVDINTPHIRYPSLKPEGEMLVRWRGAGPNGVRYAVGLEGLEAFEVE